MNTYHKSNYDSVQEALIVKSIEELSFEEIFKVDRVGDVYSFIVNKDITYKFQAHIGIWNNIQIKKNSLKKYIKNKEVSDMTIQSFFIEVQEICGIDDHTLSQYLEEANQTIFSELRVQKNLESINLDELNYNYIDQLLPGHPKLIMNKGRIGFDKDDLEKFAPEFSSSFKLRWLAINKKILKYGISKDINRYDLVPSEIIKTYKNLDFENFLICPVHPWQWSKYLNIQFLEEIIQGNIIDLGEIGDKYTPQASIRTLSNISDDNAYDIKLSLSILNTSCVRGIPAKYIENGHHISSFVSKIVKEDPFLKTKIDVLEEVAAVNVKNHYFDQLKNSSYRYHELFGCVWRQSVKSKLSGNEIAIPTAALVIENSKMVLIKDLIERSNLSAKEWIHSYFNTIVLPLYHLQVEHGLGLVAHGQNIILVLENFVPKRLIIKDFHGDLRLSNNSKYREEKYMSSLDILPSEHLIHDLITGHFITLLRYLSRICQEQDLLSEVEFYHELGSMVVSYNSKNRKVDNLNNLLKRKIEKILVNKVRFIAGYTETNNRLRPMLGTEMTNPLTSQLGK